MGFHHVLQRLRGVLDAKDLPPGQRGLGTRRIIEARDLAELLHHFDRLDAEARLGYPPHIEQLADAAEAALAELRESEAGRNLAFALSLARPKKLKPNALAQGPGGSSPGPAGAMGCASNGDTENE